MKEKHPFDASILLALADRERSVEEREEMLEHLADCPLCRQRYEKIRRTMSFVDSRLAFLSENGALSPEWGEDGEASSMEKNEDFAWQRLQQRLAGEVPSPLWQRWEREAGTTPAGAEEAMAEGGMPAGKRPVKPWPAPSESGAGTWHRTVNQDHSREEFRMKKRRKWYTRLAAASACAGLAVGMYASGWVDRALAAMLQTFRIEHLVGVNQTDLTQLEQAFNQAGVTHLDLKEYGEIERSGDTAMQQVTIAKAQQMVGYPLRMLPGSSPERDEVMIQPAQELTFRPHVKPINELIRRLGGKTQFPETVEGQPIVLHFPATVVQSKKIDKNGENWVQFQQLKAPSIDVPQGVNMEEIRNALLDLPFLPQDMRERLTSAIDWKKTLFIPMEHRVRNLSLNGNEAVLNETMGERTLIWIEHGTIYVLEGSASTFPSDESIISFAQELAQ